jgi:hypothetical protein
MVEKSGAEVLALLADEVPDGPRRCDLITLQELAQCLSKALTTESKELTAPLAGKLLIKALSGIWEYENTPSARLPIYVINEFYNRRLGDKKRIPTDEDMEDYLAACRAGDYQEAPRVKVSERTETINHLIKSHKTSFSDVKRGDSNPNQYPGDMLAVVREDAFKAFGMASFLEQPPPDPAPAVIQSDPNPAPAVDLKPTKKPGDDWTPADYAELLRQYNDMTNINKEKAERARRLIAEAWGYKPDSIRGFVTKARKLQ